MYRTKVQPQKQSLALDARGAKALARGFKDSDPDIQRSFRNRLSPQDLAGLHAVTSKAVMAFDQRNDCYAASRHLGK